MSDVLVLQACLNTQSPINKLEPTPIGVLYARRVCRYACARSIHSRRYQKQQRVIFFWNREVLYTSIFFKSKHLIQSDAEEAVAGGYILRLKIYKAQTRGVPLHMWKLISDGSDDNAPECMQKSFHTHSIEGFRSQFSIVYDVVGLQPVVLQAQRLQNGGAKCNSNFASPHHSLVQFSITSSAMHREPSTRSSSIISTAASLSCRQKHSTSS